MAKEAIIKPWKYTPVSCNNKTVFYALAVNVEDFKSVK